MKQSREHTQKILEITVVLIVCVTALSLISPAVSKKPERIVDKLSDDTANDVVGIEVYWDVKCTSRVDSIEWGPIGPGEEKQVTVFVKNKGKSQVFLSYFVSNWNSFELMDWLQLTWDYSGQPLSFKDTVQVVFTLRATEGAQQKDGFSFDITIVGN
jgi:hypothetical protein